ncbi:MAG: glycerate kinase [Daejeonella sp.]|uniref:glycerate kinase n=1 Tax=Daejeonella sp. TaxID=2805397 RepID=UPI002733D9BB|nr:glycerate kinase [Daejeonella sp.]MDP3469153.1 glycerate kinase [Daejeonella sp.]
MHILIAPNAFKHSLTANETADAIQEGLKRSGLNFTSECFPIADGGDGTGHLIVEKCGGIWHEYDVHDPLGRLIKASLGIIDQGKTAVIEMADASGIRLLNEDERSPLMATSFGTGELISFALDRQVERIIIGLGGSATVDGGVGILSALGMKFRDADGLELAAVPVNMACFHHIDASMFDDRVLKCHITVLCDVDNLLLGEQGSAAVFGPQKGASPEDVKLLDLALANLSEIAFKSTGIKMNEIIHGGAAGGIAAALRAFFKADLVNGGEHFLQITGFHESLKNADLLITGEGSLDEQTLQGKGPFAVAKYAKEKGIPVIGLAGKVPLMDHPELNKYFDLLLAIGNQPNDLETAMKFTASNLIRTSLIVGRFLSLTKSS